MNAFPIHVEGYQGMDSQKTVVAESCLRAAETGSLAFPQIVKTLMDAGFESYVIDYRRGTATYFLPSGDSIELSAPALRGAVAANFDSKTIEAAIREAQANAPGYTYFGFCSKARAAGCAGYLVSFLGRRVLYFGRSAETHVEPFPSI
jgi:uncharacterized protein YbcV (DUF1398 family)